MIYRMTGTEERLLPRMNTDGLECMELALVRLVSCLFVASPAIHSARTQVSLLPPPCEEFTT